MSLHIFMHTDMHTNWLQMHAHCWRKIPHLWAHHMTPVKLFKQPWGMWTSLESPGGHVLFFQNSLENRDIGKFKVHLKNLLFDGHCSFSAEVIRETLGGTCGSFQELAEGCSLLQGSASLGASGFLASHTRTLSQLFCFCVPSSSENSSLWISDSTSQAKIRFKG